MSRPAAIAPATSFDIDAFTQIPRMKLTALSYLLSQLRDENAPDEEVFEGLSYILDDIRDALTAEKAAEKVGA